MNTILFLKTKQKEKYKCMRSFRILISVKNGHVCREFVYFFSSFLEKIKSEKNETLLNYSTPLKIYFQKKKKLYNFKLFRASFQKL